MFNLLKNEEVSYLTKRTIENCAVIKNAVKRGLGEPEIQLGKCLGYSNGYDDEPCEKCKDCKLNTAYED